MDKLLIKGSRPLKGEVTISGAKNAALPMLVASLLTSDWHSYYNVPKLRDIVTIKRLLANLGVEFEACPERSEGTRQGECLKANAANLKSYIAPYDLVRTMRASILVLGPLVARLGRARVSLPGGCAIGARPIDLHLKGLVEMGAEIRLDQGYIEARARHLKGANIYLDIPTVTGTENLMMAAILAKGVTVIKNAAREPEIEALAQMLNKCGARIEGVGTNTISIEGTSGLSGAECTVIPDRIEAGTYMVAAGITGGEIIIKNCGLNYMQAVVDKLRETGMTIEEKGSNVVVKAGTPIHSIDVTTLPYPGFPTDMQAQFMALMCLGDGVSVITERIFENRFMHVLELKRMGANINIDGSSAIVGGVQNLKGAPVMASDLRASASLVLAGLAAKGATEVYRVYHLDRGYERIEVKLKALGAEIERIPA